MQPSVRTFANVQCLRAFAAFMVFVHHVGPQLAATGKSAEWFQALAKIGPAGVDLFFVISGFVLAHTTAGKVFDANGVKRFLGRRLLRIYLGYWPFFLLTLLFAVLVVPSALDNVNWVASLLLTNRNMETLLLPVAWTLVYELYFYVLFAVILCAPLRWRVPVFVLCFAAVVLHPLLHLDKNEPLRMILSFAFVEFFLGVLLYQVQHRLTSRWAAPVCAVGGIWLAYIAVAYNFWFGITRGCTIGVAALLLVIAAVTAEKTRFWIAGKWLVAVGDASYTLYLCNILLLNAFAYSGMRDWLTTQSSLIFIAGFAALLWCVPAISVVFYRCVEAPLYRNAVRRMLG